MKKENGGKFGKLIWRQIKKQKIAGNVKHQFGREKEKNGSRKQGNSLGVISVFFPGIEIVVPSGGIPVSLNQFARKRITTISLELISTKALT